MSTEVAIFARTAALTIPVTAVPASFDVLDAGRVTHAAVIVNHEDLRLLAIAAVNAVLALDSAEIAFGALSGIRADECAEPERSVLDAANFGGMGDT